MSELDSIFQRRLVTIQQCSVHRNLRFSPERSDTVLPQWGIHMKQHIQQIDEGDLQWDDTNCGRSGVDT
ncbi:hypothetical protein DVS77_06595 [Mycolicibacterium moriokaense]|nr:hypothetical protein DVS77_06595 [Mycolicibacterium moriokaense]